MPDAPAPETLLELEIDAPAVGGECLARDREGRVVLVAGALPGDRVLVEVMERRPTLSRAVVVEVLQPGAGRIDPVCPAVEAGCGGCDLAHADRRSQAALKVAVVRDAWRRVGRFAPEELERLAPRHRQVAGGLRTTVRVAIDGDGRPGFRRRRSHDVVVPVSGCGVVHPLLDELVTAARFPGAEEVVLRVTGVGDPAGPVQRFAVVSPAAAADRAVVPPDVIRLGALPAPGEGPHGFETIAGRRLRVSPGAFLQAHPEGAGALVAAVADAMGPLLESARQGRARTVDLYGGIGMFAACLGLQEATVVEANRWAAADAEFNLNLNLRSRVDPAPGVSVVRCSVERWRPGSAEVVIADPPRAGLGRAGVEAVMATGVTRVVLVSCDPAAGARDARLLADRGLRPAAIELVDLFPDTHHIEAVTTFVSADVEEAATT